MKYNIIIVLFISFFGVLSDCANGWSSGRKKRHGIWLSAGLWSQNEPKDIYFQNNNRIDRQKHAQCNKQIHQPRSNNYAAKNRRY